MSVAISPLYYRNTGIGNGSVHFSQTGYAFQSPESASLYDGDLRDQVYMMRQEMKCQHKTHDNRLIQLMDQVKELTNTNVEINKKLASALALLRERSLRTSLCRVFIGCTVIMSVLLPIAIFCDPLVFVSSIVIVLFISLIGYFISSCVKV